MKRAGLFVTLAAFALMVPELRADLQLTVTGPDEGLFGERVTYEYTIFNSGPGPAENIEFSYNLPGEFPLDMQAPGTACDNPVPLPSGECHAGSLAAGSSRTIVATALLPSNSFSTGASGSVRSDAPDEDVTNNFAQTGTRLILSSGSADLSATATSTATDVVPGGTVEVTVTAHNESGSTTATDVLLRIEYTDNLQLTNVISDGWTCEEIRPSSAAPFAFCRRASLAPGASSPVTVSLLAADDLSFGSVRGVVGADGSPDFSWLNNFVTLNVSTVPSADDLETILLPIVSGEVPGAFGSLWKSDLKVRVTAGDPVTLFPLDNSCQILCPPESTTGIPISGGTTLELPLFMPQPGAPPALLLYTLENQSERLAFNLRIQDLSRQALTWGTEIPVVREHEFYSGVVNLLNVPLDDRFRQMLRIYDMNGRDGTQVLVRFYSMDELPETGSAPLLQIFTTLRAPAVSPGATGLPAAPAYAQIADFANLPQLAGIEQVRLEIEPIGIQNEDVGIWAFVSVTNNETQHVTTITPQ